MFKNVFVYSAKISFGVFLLINSLHAYSDDSIKKTISGGEVFTVTLQDIPGTGYKWMLRTLPSNVMLVSENYRQPASCGEKAKGCAVERTFTFKGIRQGSGNIHLVYGRPWLNITEKTSTIQVSVRSNPSIR